MCLYLPKGEWFCLNCGAEWFGEYGKYEIVKCVTCASENVRKNEGRIKI